MALMQPDVEHDFLTAEGNKVARASGRQHLAEIENSSHELLKRVKKIIYNESYKADALTMHFRLKELLALITMSPAQIDRENEALQTEILIASEQLRERHLLHRKSKIGLDESLV